MLLCGALSFNLIFPSNEPNIWRLIGMWSILMFTIPSLRARDCSKNEKEALSYLFLLIPLLNVINPFLLKLFAVVWSADTVAFVFAMYTWKWECCVLLHLESCGSWPCTSKNLWCTMSDPKVFITYKRRRNLEGGEAPQENGHPDPPGGANHQENVHLDPPVDLATDTASNTSDKQEEVAEGNKSEDPEHGHKGKRNSCMQDFSLKWELTEPLFTFGRDSKLEDVENHPVPSEGCIAAALITNNDVMNTSASTNLVPEIGSSLEQAEKEPGNTSKDNPCTVEEVPVQDSETPLDTRNSLNNAEADPSHTLLDQSVPPPDSPVRVDCNIASEPRVEEQPVHTLPTRIRDLSELYRKNRKLNMERRKQKRGNGSSSKQVVGAKNNNSSKSSQVLALKNNCLQLPEGGAVNKSSRKATACADSQRKSLSLQPGISPRKTTAATTSRFVPPSYPMEPPVASQAANSTTPQWPHLGIQPRVLSEGGIAPEHTSSYLRQRAIFNSFADNRGRGESGSSSKQVVGAKNNNSLKSSQLFPEGKAVNKSSGKAAACADSQGKSPSLQPGSNGRNTTTAKTLRFVPPSMSMEPLVASQAGGSTPPHWPNLAIQPRVLGEGGIANEHTSSYLRQRAIFDSFADNRGRAGSGNRSSLVDRIDIPWAEDELDHLWMGVRRHGRGNWYTILKDKTLHFSPCRSARDLFERWEVERYKHISRLLQNPNASNVPTRQLQNPDANTRVMHLMNGLNRRSLFDNRPSEAGPSRSANPTTSVDITHWLKEVVAVPPRPSPSTAPPLGSISFRLGGAEWTMLPYSNPSGSHQGSRNGVTLNQGLPDNAEMLNVNRRLHGIPPPATGTVNADHRENNAMDLNMIVIDDDASSEETISDHRGGGA